MKLSYINVFVRDLAASVHFYQGVLGLELQFCSPEHGYASFVAGEGLRLGLAVAGTENVELVGRHTGVGFEVHDLVAAYDRLESLGARFTMPPTRQPWGAFMAILADPDGNAFYLDQATAPPH